MKRTCVVALALLTWSCGAPAAPSAQDAAAPVPFLEVQIILNGSGCTESGCHGIDRKGGLDLVEDPYASLVGARANGCEDPERRRVVSGRPEASYLIDKVRGRRLCGGGRMPFGCDGTRARPCMTEARIATLEDWIRQGAPVE